MSQAPRPIVSEVRGLLRRFLLCRKRHESAPWSEDLRQADLYEMSSGSSMRNAIVWQKFKARSGSHRASLRRIESRDCGFAECSATPDFVNKRVLDLLLG